MRSDILNTLTELRDALAEKSAALALALRLVDKADSGLDNADEESLLLKDWHKIVMANNIERIHDNSQSYIEKVFMTSLVLCALPKDITLIFTPKFDSVTDAVKAYREMDEVVTNLRQEYEKISGESNVFGFTEWVKRMDMFSEEEKVSVSAHAVMYQEFDLKNAFHVTPQASFREIKVNNHYVRPDFYLWIPSKPLFNLIVECDGFAYHSDRESFSRDRVRDRILQTKGFQVFRYSGSEICASPVGITKHLLDYLSDNDQRYGNGA